MNSKIIIFALVASFCLLTINAMPVTEEEIQEAQQAPRQKRVTCDLLSASIDGNQLNHSACAAHCLTLKYKGGYCDKGVCHCRR